MIKSETDNIFKNVISPRDEMIAFETLWATEGMTDGKLSKLFNGTALPSEILRDKMGFIDSELKSIVTNYLDNLKVDFSVSINGDHQYPKKLREAKHPIELFYYKGDAALLENNCISIVGSRKCTNEGKLRTRRLTKLLVENRYTIVSGLATGVDTVALETAIKENGKVIGVIGTPINKYYPKENRDLQDKISREHLLISQVPFYRYYHEPFQSRKNNFPRRNATMSAISQGTVIIEASDTSGTLTQARAAMQQGRKLFILNSCFEKSSISWPKQYEKEGAIRVEEIEDVIRVLKR